MSVIFNTVGFPQASDSCGSSSSGVYSIIEPTRTGESEKTFHPSFCDKGTDERKKPAGDMRGTRVSRHDISEEQFHDIDQYEPMLIANNKKALASESKHRKSTIYKMKEKQCDIQKRLGILYTKEDKIQEEIQYTSLEFKKIEDKLVDVARMYEVDKFKLHILEIEKIMALILGLKHRMTQVESALNNFEWNGVEERFDLERKRDKLIKQLEEAKELWTFIDKRTGVVAGYIEHYLAYETVVQFRQLVKNKVNQMVEIKTLKNDIGLLLHIIR